MILDSIFQNIKKLKASSLLEVLIAMLIGMVTFFITMAIVVNVFGANPIVRGYYYQSLVQTVLTEAMLTEDFEDRVYQESEEVQIIKTVRDYPYNSQLWSVQVQVLNSSGKQLAMGERLFNKSGQ